MTRPPAQRPTFVRRVDHVRAAMKAAKRKGRPLADEIGDVLFKLIDMAKAGDVSAAKLVIDRLGVPDSASREDVQATATQILIVTGVPARDGTSVHVETPPHVLADVSECETVEDAAKANLKAMGYSPDGRPLQDRAPRLP